jgi:hypothetical protein
MRRLGRDLEKANRWPGGDTASCLTNPRTDLEQLSAQSFDLR